MFDSLRGSWRSLVGSVAIVGGALLGAWAVCNLPAASRVTVSATSQVANQVSSAVATVRPTALPAVPTFDLPTIMLPAQPLPTASATPAASAQLPAIPLTPPTTATLPGADVEAERIMVPVDYWAALSDDVSLDRLQSLWHGTVPQSDGGYKSLLISPDVQSWLTILWGPMSAGAPVSVVPATDFASKLWTTSGSVGIVPFDRLEPRLHALRLNGVDALAREADVSAYPLRARIQVPAGAPATNRLPERMTRLIMTGTTALTRTTADRIERYHDYAWPARKIAPVLAGADITHVSNEIPFVPNCPVVLDTLKFCSKPEYLATFKLAGVKLVGLTGNHLIDYGPEAMNQTLDIYQANGIGWYGGGRNLEDASKPLILTDHGNRLAFLGANMWGPPSDWAGASTPGSMPYDRQRMTQAIKDAHTQADLVFVELQWVEEYTSQPLPGQLQDFPALSDAGADVVTGVQAHQPQAFAFRNGKPILYGLGNLFFDQMWSEPTRQGLVVRHTIYAGKLISTELLVTIIEDYGQPRWATPAERAAILKPLYTLSGW